MDLFRKIVATTLLLLLFLSNSFLSAHASFCIEPMFSVIWITDTQYLSEKFPWNFDTVCKWIVDHEELLNVKAVIHTGDMVEHSDNMKEWNRANHSMSILLKNDIPYCWDAGNHDQFGGVVWYGKNFTTFDAEMMSEKNYWVSDKLNGKNTAIRFRAADWDFLVINIEFQPSYEVLKWVNRLLELYPDYHTIIAIHAYLNGVGEYEDWEESFEQEYFEQKVLAIHSNVFLTLNGHFTDGNRTSRTFTNNRHELFFNYQHTGGAGDATIRILTFSKEDDTIFVNTINTVKNQFLVDPANCFTLGIPFYEESHNAGNLTLLENSNLTKCEGTEWTEVLPEFPHITCSMFILVFLISSPALIKRKIRKTQNC